jgi:CBS domain containing-hemolysin-like protein
MKNKILHLIKAIFSRSKEENKETEEKEETLVENFIENIKVSEIMIPRADLVAVALDSTKEDITKLFLETGFLRLLVYGKDLDDIIGFLDLRVFFPFFVKKEILNINKIIQKPLYTTRSTKALQLFDRLEREEADLAIVLDEYGGIEGMVIIEKLMEKLITPLQKDEEEESNSITKITDNSYILDGRTPIQKVQELFTDLDFLSEEEGEYETISGFVLSYLDKVPTQGEKFTHPKGLEVSIMDANTRLVKTVKITRLPCN